MGVASAIIGGIAGAMGGGGGGGGQQQQPQQKPPTPIAQYDATPYNAPRQEVATPWAQAYQPNRMAVGSGFGNPNPGQITPFTGQTQSAFGQLNRPPNGMPAPPGGMPQAPKYAPAFGYEPQREAWQAWGDKGTQQQRDEFQQYQNTSSGSLLGSAGMSVGHWLATGRWTNPLTPFMGSSNRQQNSRNQGGFTGSGGYYK